jgi:hypothetical protein
MLKDLPTTDISAERLDMDIKSNIVNCAVEAGREHQLSMDSRECTPEIDVVVQDSDEEDNGVLPLGDWKGDTEEDNDQLFRHLYVDYKDFDKRHRSYQLKYRD